MTQEEKLIVSAYTGFLMTDMGELQTFIEKEVLERPVFTHELADKAVQKEISERIKPRFLALCNDGGKKT